MNKRGPNDEIEDEVKKRTRDSLISVEESELYDRQIRVWGIEVQEILRNSRILVVGMNGINCEVLKNLTLIGIGHVTLVDSSIVQEKDLNLFLSTNDIGSFVCSLIKINIINLESGYRCSEIKGIESKSRYCYFFRYIRQRYGTL